MNTSASSELERSLKTDLKCPVCIDVRNGIHQIISENAILYKSDQICQIEKYCSVTLELEVQYVKVIMLKQEQFFTTFFSNKTYYFFVDPETFEHLLNSRCRNGPIFQCDQGGHIICLRCYFGLENKICPVCKGAFACPPARNRALESVIETLDGYEMR
jgi:hypothetical protein